MDIVLLARKYPAGTSELFPLGSNSDLGRNFTPRNFFPLACKVWIYVEVVQYVEFSPLVWNSLAGASEWFLFCANSDLRRNCIQRKKSSFRHLRIYLLLAPARNVLGSENSWRFLLGDSSSILLVPQKLIYFGASLDICWNFTLGTSELIPFGACSDRLWDLQSLNIPSWGFLLVFPCWGLLWLFVHGELHFPPLGIYYSSLFLGNYIYHQMIDCLRSPWPIRRLLTYARLIY